MNDQLQSELLKMVDDKMKARRRQLGEDEEKKVDQHMKNIISPSATTAAPTTTPAPSSSSTSSTAAATAAAPPSKANPTRKDIQQATKVAQASFNEAVKDKPLTKEEAGQRDEANKHFNAAQQALGDNDVPLITALGSVVAALSFASAALATVAPTVAAGLIAASATVGAIIAVIKNKTPEEQRVLSDLVMGVFKKISDFFESKTSVPPVVVPVPVPPVQPKPVPVPVPVVQDAQQK